jgi:RNA polymerase sigma factor (sigma-70 family)
VIDDACQFAWSRLVQHRRRIEPGGAQAWLVRTAAREAVKQIRRQRRDVSLEALLEAAGDEFEPCGTQTFAELIDRRDRLAAIHALPERQRRLIWLQGLGLSYREMARETGATERTVERQLMRARRRLSAVTG